MKKSSTGRWEEDNRRPRSVMFRCSLCGGLAYAMQGKKSEPKRCIYKFCPHCGARMGGELMEDMERYRSAARQVAAGYVPEDRGTLLEAVEALARVTRERDAAWISVKDRLPEQIEKVLCTYHFVIDGKESPQRWVGVLEYYATVNHPHFQHESIGIVVTHWMPIPKPPCAANDPGDRSLPPGDKK